MTDNGSPNVLQTAQRATPNLADYFDRAELLSLGRAAVEARQLVRNFNSKSGGTHEEFEAAADAVSHLWHRIDHGLADAALVADAVEGRR